MSAVPSMLSSEACAQTNMPRRQLGQPCKHFDHRLKVMLEDWHGRIEFPTGVCELDASAQPGTLTMRVTARDEPAFASLEDVVARHLTRFAFREEMAVQWNRTV